MISENKFAKCQMVALFFLGCLSKASSIVSNKILKEGLWNDAMMTTLLPD